MNRPSELAEEVIAGCCASETTALLVLPEPRLLINTTFAANLKPRIVLNVSGPTQDRIPAAAVGCVYFRFDTATYVLLCRIVTVSGVEEMEQVVLEILSACVTRDRSAFRVPVLNQRGLKVELIHPTGRVPAKLRDISRTGAHVEVGLADKRKWTVKDAVLIKIQVGELFCEMKAHIARVSNTVGLEFAAPVTGSSHNSLRAIVAELERRYLRQRIPS